MSYRTDVVNDKAIKVSKDAVTYCTSGLVDQDRNIPLSYLHKAIRPANQLRMMENAVVIYRITRAPERRIFYIDVGNLPTGKAEQYLKDVMSRYRNKLVYDSDTGEIRDDKKFMSMLEDFWLPRKEGGRGTEIQTLPGGANLGEIEDVVYFQKKLYQSLNVPISRLEQQSGLNFGRSAEITRDELKFTKFVSKLRNRFSGIFDDLLKTQLVLKGVINEDEWPEIKNDLQYMYAQDAYYTESKEQEILRSRLEILNGVVPFIGQLFSKEYVQKNIMRFSDEEIQIMDGQIAASQEEGEEPQILMEKIMSEEQVEVEVTDEVTPQDAVRNMMDKWADGDYTAANDEFAKAMGTRADELISARKEEISNAIFNDPELQKMGLEAAPEEELEQTETDTGETNEDI